MPIDADAAERDRAAVARHAARRQPAAAPRARLRAGARRRRASRSTWRTRALALLEVDEHGFDEIDRRLLRTIIDKFGGGPVGRRQPRGRDERGDATRIEDIYEPFLIQIGFLDRTPRGRVATPRAYEYFGLTRPWKGSVCGERCRHAAVGPSVRRVKIAGLSTYVPPRVLTNADLEKMVDTTDEWILQRTGIRERHIVDPGVATSDLAKEAAVGAMRQAGVTPDRHRLHRRRHDDARHDLSEHGVRAAAQDRRAPRVGVRSRRGVLGLHVLADDGDADGGDRRARPRAGRRRRRDVEHHRLHRSRDVRALRRRRRRGGAAPADDDEPRIIDFAHEIDGSGGPALCMPAGGSRLPASHETVDEAAALREAGRADGLQVRGARRPRRSARRLLDRNGLQPSRPRSVRVAPGEPPDHHGGRRAARPGPGRRSSSTSSSTATRPPRRSRSRSRDARAPGAPEEGRPRAARVGRAPASPWARCCCAGVCRGEGRGPGTQGRRSHTPTPQHTSSSDCTAVCAASSSHGRFDEAFEAHGGSGDEAAERDAFVILDADVLPRPADCERGGQADFDPRARLADVVPDSRRTKRPQRVPRELL